MNYEMAHSGAHSRPQPPTSLLVFSDMDTSCDEAPLQVVIDPLRLAAWPALMTDLLTIHPVERKRTSPPLGVQLLFA